MIVHSLLFAWYEKHRRDLPWRQIDYRFQTTDNRQIRDPYHILVSELMLQQTQVSRVIPKYLHFLARWPTIDALAKAKLAEVITEWQGLGYNRRAKHLLETAKLVVHEYGGTLPSDPIELRKLPGFGPYMVSALRVFAFGAEERVVDVNVVRVLSRVETGLSPVSTKEIHTIAEQMIPKNRADEWHQLLMDFGSLVCSAKSPSCESCPVSRICAANKAAQTMGATNFAAWLATQPKVKKSSPKDSGKKFEETDRYFRGRTIDFLRTGESPMESVWQHLHTHHHLADRVRFGRIIESLVIDGLIAIRGTTVSLA